MKKILGRELNSEIANKIIRGRSWMSIDLVSFAEALACALGPPNPPILVVRNPPGPKEAVNTPERSRVSKGAR